jgi:very-short-patch-repair endonuclease
MDKDNEIEFVKNLQSNYTCRVVCNDVAPFTLYNAVDIGKILEITRIRTSLAHYSALEKVVLNTETAGGVQKCLHLTYLGIKKLIHNSRKNKVEEFIIKTKLSIECVKYICIEADMMTYIKNAFQGEMMVDQFAVLKYKIDLYFPKYKIAVECDEHAHTTKSHDRADIIRQDAITREISCEFIRFRPMDANFNIMSVINQIFHKIKQHKQTSNDDEYAAEMSRPLAIAENDQVEDYDDEDDDNTETNSVFAYLVTVQLYPTTTPMFFISSSANFKEACSVYEDLFHVGRIEYCKELELPNGKSNDDIKRILFGIFIKYYNHETGMYSGLSYDEARRIIKIVKKVGLPMMANNIQNPAIIKHIIDNELAIKSERIVLTPKIGVEMSTQTTEIEFAQDKDPGVNGKFDKFISECCVIGDTFEVKSSEIVGQYRIQSQSLDKDTYHQMLNYLKTRFTPKRLDIQDSDAVNNGFRGVQLKVVNYKMSNNPSDPEKFTFQMCKMEPGGKALSSDLVDAYTKWKNAQGKPSLITDRQDLKRFLDNCPYTLGANIWKNSVNGAGYYGISFKVEIPAINAPIKIARNKKVEKRTLDHVVITSYSTISKASMSEGINAAMLSRYIKSNFKFEDHYFCFGA